MKLRTKVLGGYSIVLALVVVVGVVAVFNIQRLGNASEAILRENYRSILAAENMIDTIERQDSGILLMLLGYEQQGLRQFRENEVEFLQWLGRAKDNITIEGEAQILKTLEKNYQDYLVAFSQLREVRVASSSSPSAYYYQTVLPQFKQVRNVSIQLRELNQRTMVEASNQAQVTATRAIWSMLVIGTAALGLGLAFSLLLSNRLVRPLRKMTQAAERIAEGNYDVVLRVKSSDELGFLAQKIATMSHKLKAFHELNVGKVIAEKQRSEAIIRSITDALIVVDAEFEIIALNPRAAQILGTTPEQAQGSHFLEAVKSRDLYDHIKTTAQTGMPPQLNEEQSILPVLTGDQTQYYQFAITAVNTEEGKMLGVVLLLQDVTKLKELDQLKSEFVSTASHELRTPLTSMAMSIDLLLENAQQKLSEREQELLQSAQEDVQRLRTLVNDLLDLSKIESGRIEMVFESCSVSEIVERAIAAFSVQAEEKEVALTQEIDPDLPAVKADASKIIQVLTNLISNALRYTDAGGHIQVKARQLGNFVSVSVSDDGPGIPSEYLSRIFDKFVQVKTKRDIGGSGLGLAISKEIVRAHGGTIWVDSTLDRGSTFTFTLPVVTNQQIKRITGEQVHA